MKIRTLVIAFLVVIGNLNAQDKTTVEASTDISENLDLKAVASLFGEAKNLEDFEKKLNDPKTQISNLDLNEDGEVDYLRVIEVSKNKTHLVTIQAVLEKDKYQDVATIDVEKDESGKIQVQIVGDVYMYGTNYIIEPVYVNQPVIYVWFWGPYYSPWYSPYYWGYYPYYYHPWHPHPHSHYRANVNVYINVNNTYNHTTIRRSKTSIELQNKSKRNDYAIKNPNNTFSQRNKGLKNKQDLDNGNNRKQSTGKKVQDNWKPKVSKKIDSKNKAAQTRKPKVKPKAKKSKKAKNN